jgi:cyclopropane-fatty-acyl-phospholipid synthase
LPGHLRAALLGAGITLDGPNPWDPQVRNPRMFERLAVRGALGAGESYMDGDWECERLDELTARLIRSGLYSQWESYSSISPGNLLAHLVNRQSRRAARRNVEAHYEIGNDVFAATLGPTMSYTCGYWAEAKTLDEAQEAKHEMACQKLQFTSGLHTLDIGCGWGGFSRHVAERHQAQVTGITLSKSQAEFARESCQGLPVTIRLEDFRDVRGRFERIVALGVIEHAGPKNHRAFFRKVHENLAPDGLFLLQTIGCLRTSPGTDRWIDRYIFPNAVIPSASQLQQASEGLLVMEDWHNFGADYDRTLMAWHANFEGAWPALRERYDERFRRMWRYYLLTCAASFRVRRNQLWQIVFSRHGVPGGYRRIGH